MTDRNTERPQDQDLPASGAPDAQADSSASDDWAAALAEQTAASQPAAAPATQADGLDEWAGAMAEQAAATPAAAEPAAVKPAQVFQPLSGAPTSVGSDIDLIMDVPVQLTVELGRSRMTIKNLLQLGQGSVVELDGLAGEPMDIYVNGYLIAQGEVVVVEDRYGIRLTDIITPSERINRLNNRR